MLRFISFGLIVTLASSCGSLNSKSDQSAKPTDSTQSTGREQKDERNDQFEDEHKTISHKPGSRVPVGTAMFIKIKIEKQYVGKLEVVVDEHFEAEVDEQNLCINFKPVKKGYGSVEIKISKSSGWKSSETFSYEVVE